MSGVLPSALPRRALRSYTTFNIIFWSNSNVVYTGLASIVVLKREEVPGAILSLMSKLNHILFTQKKKKEKTLHAYTDKIH